MEEKDFELLCLLEETKNITKAAEKMYITQSALSKRIKAMETELNVELLLRSRQGVHFTPAGEIVLTHAKNMRQEMRQMQQQLSRLGEEVCGTIEVGVSVNFSIYRLPDILASFYAKYPKVKVCIQTGHSAQIYKKFVEGTLDVAVIRGHYPWEGTRFLLEEEHMCLICAEEYRDVPLSEYMYISHTTDSEQSAMMARWMHENGLVSAPAGFHVDSLTACTEMVKRGLGWALIPEIALDDFDGEKKHCLFSNGEPFLRSTYILSRKETQELPQIRVFIDELRQARAGKAL